MKFAMSVIAGLLVIGIGGMLGFAVNRSELAEEHIRNHELIDGHPVMIERVGHIERDMSEIKASLKRIEHKLSGR